MSQAKRMRKLEQIERKKKNKKRLKIAIIALIIIALGVASIFVIPELTKIPEDKYPVATVSIEGYGDIEITLYPNEAPNTVKNFIELANSGEYDNIKIARACQNFCIQMGSKNGTISEETGWSIKGEFADNGFTKNTIKHEKGVISMARGTENDTASNQFFICTATNSNVANLDGAYAAFGKVTSGMNIIDELNGIENDGSISAGGGKPLTDIVIKSVRVDTKGVSYAKPSRIQE